LQYEHKSFSAKPLRLSWSHQNGMKSGENQLNAWYFPPVSDLPALIICVKSTESGIGG
jgi:hypothetical protein